MVIITKYKKERKMIFTLMMILDAVFKEYEPGDTY